MRRDLSFFILAIAVLSLPLLHSCHNRKGAKEDIENSESLSGEIPGGSMGEIIVSREQFEASAMKIGDPLTTMFQEVISATGYITASPTGSLKISSMISGRVKDFNISIGERIQKGQLLFTLESNEIILLQQEYAEVYYNLNALKSNYERQKMLSEEQITSQKDFINAESDYKSLHSKAEGLKARLRMINIDPLQIEKGAILPVASIRSPMNGVVTKIDMVPGQFIEPQASVLEIIDPGKLQLKIHVFEKDLKDLVVGQDVLFYDPGDVDRALEATLSYIGKSIDPESKTLQCIAKLKSLSENAFAHNMYVKTEIITCHKEVLAIPVQALIQEEDQNFVLTLIGEKEDKFIFRKIPIHVGDVQKGYVQIMDEEVKNLLIGGGYNLFSAL